MQVRHDQNPLTRPDKGLKPGQAVREMFVITGDPENAVFHQLTDGLKARPIDQNEVNQAIDAFETVWTDKDPGAERQKALTRLARDRQTLEESGAEDLSELAHWLEEREAQRKERLEWTQVGLAGLALVGAAGYVGQILLPYRLGAVGTGLCGVAFFTGAVGLNLAESHKKRPAEPDQAARFHLYARVAQESRGVEELADSVNVDGTQVAFQEDGILVGGTFLDLND